MTDMRTGVRDLQRNLKIGAQQFRCEHDGKCEESIHKRLGHVEASKGDWTYVGYQYGRAMINGKCAKILFVAMERTEVSSEDERFKYEPFEGTQRAFRDLCFERGNAHMGGTDVVLKCLLDETTTCEGSRTKCATRS